MCRVYSGKASPYASFKYQSDQITRSGHLPRTLRSEERSLVLPHYRTALDIALRSDCSEAQFGAVVFYKQRELARGFNHVPDHLKEIGWACKSHCPRLGVEQLKGGVGSELCFVIHAEEDAADNLAKLPVDIRRGVEQKASMVVARLKNRKEVLPIGAQNVRCTACAKKIANETQIREIVFPIVIAGEMQFAAYGRVEFHTTSIINLYERWTPVLSALPGSQ